MDLLGLAYCALMLVAYAFAWAHALGVGPLQPRPLPLLRVHGAGYGLLLPEHDLGATTGLVHVRPRLGSARAARPPRQPPSTPPARCKRHCKRRPRASAAPRSAAASLRRGRAPRLVTDATPAPRPRLPPQGSQAVRAAATGGSALCGQRGRQRRDAAARRHHAIPALPQRTPPACTDTSFSPEQSVTQLQACSWGRTTSGLWGGVRLTPGTLSDSQAARRPPPAPGAAAAPSHL